VAVTVISLQRNARRSDRARQVRDLLRTELFAGTYAGGVLPDETNLSERYSCSRNALREALALLTREGLIVRVPGAGTFASLRQLANRHDHLVALSEQLEETSRVSVQPLELRLAPAPEPVAYVLGLLPTEEVVYFERRLLLDDGPLSVWSSYLPADRAAGLLCADLQEDFYQLVERHLGIRIAKADLSVTAIVADPALAPLLGIAEGAPVIHITRVARQENGHTLELGYGYMRADRIRLVSELKRVQECG
jgi:GntR family transcriptional regulator